MLAEKAKTVLLVGHSFIFLIALTSLYWQVPGLYGEKGLTPVATKIACEESSCSTLRDGINVLPIVVNFLRISPSFALQVLLVFGIILASLSILFSFMRNTLTYLGLFIIYSTALQVGDVFLWFQWDTLLIESTVICVLLAPVPFIGSSSADNVSLFLMRWLIFRLMYASGVVKLTSHCPHWWDLSALDIHFESQCIPTWVAYYAHQTPQWFKHFSVALTFYIEIILPPLFLLPFKLARRFSFYPQIFLMVLIMLTGNYNFFNILIALQCVAIIVDSDEYNFSTKGLCGSYARLVSIIGNIVSLGVIVFTVAVFIKYFNIGIDVSGMAITSSIAFTSEELSQFVEDSTLWFLYVGVVAFICEVLTALVRFFTESNASKLKSFIHLIYVLSVGTYLFTISTVPFSATSSRAQSVLPPLIKQLHEQTDVYQLTHAYGLFRRMTGTYGRPEVILEGSHEPNGPWTEFDFYAKPGPLGRKQRYIFPHQPRLDWQMWFAALGAYQHNPFFISLTYHLLRNNSEVTYLMREYPFKKQLPDFVRASLYLYHYTKRDEKGVWPRNYWRRDFQEEYMPPITRDDPGFANYLIQNGFILKDEWKITNQNLHLQKWLRYFHEMVKSIDPAVLVHSMIAAHFAAYLAFSMFR